MALKRKDRRELELPGPIDPVLAEQLVEQARADGVDLVGPGGLLGEFTEQVLEAGLEVEMEEHLGYDKRLFSFELLCPAVAGHPCGMECLMVPLRAWSPSPL